jgi:predicted  nucleic acid-binding Zn-ribbon protein
METLSCIRCGHMWIARSSRKPLACPACKSYGWNKERKDNANTSDVVDNA